MNSPYRFTLLAHAQEIVDCVTAAVIDDPEVTLHSYVARSDDLIQIARKQLEQGQEGILCHGGTGNAIVNAIGPSAVAISRTDMDVIKTLIKAKKHSQDICIVTYSEEYRDIQTLQHILHIRLFDISFAKREGHLTKIDRLYSEGIRVLVGGGISAKRMTELGGVGMVVLPNIHSIHEAIQRAKAIAKQKRIDAQRLNELGAIFSHLKEGVVCVDNSCTLLFVNKTAKQLLNLEENSPKILWIQVFEKLFLKNVLMDLETRREEIVTLRNRQLIVTATTLLTASIAGAVAIFSDVSTVQKIHRKISESRFNNNLVARYSVKDIKGKSTEIVRLREHIKCFAPTDAAVLITGETGTGKERVAHAVHSTSRRHKAPFVAVNIAALPESLMESELFGYEEGAFTGAKRGGKLGLLEIANRGTLFLDEVGDLSLPLQLRLLRVLESKEVMRVGASSFIPVDIRIISATHHSLMDLVRQGKFRLDLYFRLSTLTLAVPPLRIRSRDIPLLSEATFMHHGFAQDHLSETMLRKLTAYHWPGNVRELLALLERYCVLNNSGSVNVPLLDELLAEQRGFMLSADGVCLPLKPQESDSRPTKSPYSLKEDLDSIRRELMRKVIDHHNGDKQRAAKELGISYSTLWRELRANEYAKTGVARGKKKGMQ